MVMTVEMAMILIVMYLVEYVMILMHSNNVNRNQCVCIDIE